ncbi:MAG: leucyl aminopeptidase [Verrucomicrobiae bacterium]|nr:leucyl aminopeptidase [Verrucomicrobiae bacterium]
MNDLHITCSTADPSKANVDALLVSVGEFGRETPPWKSLGKVLGPLCEESDPSRRFFGKEGSVVVAPSLGRIKPRFIALAGMGKTSEVGVWRRCFGAAVRKLCKNSIRSLGVLLPFKHTDLEWVVLAIEEASYQFQNFKSNGDDEAELEEIVFFAQSVSDEAIRQSTVLAGAVRRARQLANQPGNAIDPRTFALEAQQLARRRRLSCVVWDERRLKREGFGGILAVGCGSVHPPRFIRLDYRGGPARQAPVVLVGKALTFDSGGISIKPSDKMDEMKFDKSGGVAVLGIMDAVAGMRLKMNVTGLIPAAENLPSGSACRPGDLVKMLSGKYVEIMNTDAEGRVVLADALAYAQRLKPRAVVDLATLTGACLIAFARECAAVLGNDETLVEQLQEAGECTGERLWPMPMWPVFQEKVKSDVGYVKNSAGREGGTITGACFLNAFMDKSVSWAHLDIAGTAWTSSEEPYRAKGATAFGIRLITHWLRTLA